MAHGAGQGGSCIWWQGGLRHGAEAQISLQSAGLLVGEGVFETLAVRGGIVEAARLHHERWKKSAETLDLAVPDFDTVMEATRSLLAAEGRTEARLRWTLVRDDHSRPMWWAMLAPLPVWPETETVVISPWKCHSQNAMAGVKTTSYAAQVRIKREAEQRGAGEALIANERDELCEGSSSNVFVVREGVLWTPPLESGCLAGVTRALVLEAAAEMGLSCRVEAVPMAWLRDAAFEEMFLTSSTRGVHAVSRVENHPFEAPGSVTAQLREAWEMSPGSPR